MIPSERTDSRMEKRYYIAYGSNLNIRQMRMRCPSARIIGTSEIPDYELLFKGSKTGSYLTIEPKDGSTVPVAAWEVTAEDEAALDRYEGYPSHYFKQNIPVQLDGEEVNAMVYIMNLKMGFGLPSPYYYQTVYEGYNDCGLDTDVLDRAVMESSAQFYAAHRQQEPQQTLFDMDDDEDFYDPEDYDEDEPSETEPEMDENDPFYFSEGMHL